MQARLYQQLAGGGSSGVDPSRIPTDILRRIRGDMWPAIGSPTNFGPRQGQPDNILAMDYYEFSDPPTRELMRAQYKAYGWTHAVTGPMVDVGGYHGTYPLLPNVPTQPEWDHYLDCMQEWWNDGIIPIHFIHPDNWTLEDMDTLAHLYRQPRAQKLLRMNVPTGWEPTRYGWKADYWAAIIRKVRSWFAGAPAPTLWYIHTVTDVDAPTGDGDDFPNGNGGAWDRVAPLIHGWLIQNGPYEQAPKHNVQQARNFGDQFDRAVPHSIAWHFAPPYGNAGWPCVSAWGPGIPIDLIAAEQTAYVKFWHPDWFAPVPAEEAATAYGEIALTRGATGALDGCPK